MAEPENHTLHISRDIREALKELDRKVDGMNGKIDRNHGDVRGRLDNLRPAVTGEGVLGRYAAAEVEKRLEPLEKRVAALEDNH